MEWLDKQHRIKMEMLEITSHWECCKGDMVKHCLKLVWIELAIEFREMTNVSSNAL